MARNFLAHSFRRNGRVVRLWAVAALAAALIACSGDGDSIAAGTASGVTAAETGLPSTSTPATAEPAATAFLVQPSADAPPAAPTAGPTAAPTATATPAVSVAPTATLTAVPGCSRGPSAPPAIYYGFGLAEGEVVRTYNSTRLGCEDIVCERSTVDGGGFWIVRIAGDTLCGVRDGDTIIFSIDEQFSAHTETWVAGGVPADVAQGIALRE